MATGCSFLLCYALFEKYNIEQIDGQRLLMQALENSHCFLQTTTLKPYPKTQEVMKNHPSSFIPLPSYTTFLRDFSVNFTILKDKTEDICMCYCVGLLCYF